jgi:hypothetical protein
MIEVGDAVFDEYLPKVSSALRQQFLNALLTELEEQGALTVEERPDEDDTVEQLDFDV